MAVKNRHQSEDLFTGIESSLKEQLVEIFLLRNLRDEQTQTISELRDEIERLRRELDSLNNKGSVILKNTDNEATQVMERDDSKTMIMDKDNQGTQVIGKRGRSKYGDDSTEVLGDKMNKSDDAYGTQIINADEL